MTWHVFNISKAEVEQILASLFEQIFGQIPWFQFIVTTCAQLGNHILNNIYFKHYVSSWKKMLHIYF